MHAEHQDLGVRHSRDQTAYDFDAADPRQVDVHDRYVGLQVANDAISLLAAGRLGNHGNVLGTLQQTPVALANYRMIVDQDDPYGRCSCLIHCLPFRGIKTCTSAPWSGALCKSSCPPSASTRSRKPTSPSPCLR